MAQAIPAPLIEERGNIMKKRKAWLSGLLAATLVATQVVTAEIGRASCRERVF